MSIKRLKMVRVLWWPSSLGHYFTAQEACGRIQPGQLWLFIPLNKKLVEFDRKKIEKDGKEIKIEIDDNLDSLESELSTIRFWNLNGSLPTSSLCLHMQIIKKNSFFLQTINQSLIFSCFLYYPILYISISFP